MFAVKNQTTGTRSFSRLGVNTPMLFTDEVSVETQDRVFWVISSRLILRPNLGNESAGADLYVLPEQILEEILREVRPPAECVIDIQRCIFQFLTSAPVCCLQVRECTAALMKVAKMSQCCLSDTLLKKERSPGRFLEHLVDTVLYFDDRFCFSSTTTHCQKTALAQLTRSHLWNDRQRTTREVANPSELFFSNRDEVVLERDRRSFVKVLVRL